MKIVIAAVIAAVAASASAQQPPQPSGYGQPGPVYGAPYQDGTTNGGYGDPGRGYGGPEATFFVDDNFRGRSITLNRGIRRLGPSGMEDKISSIGIRSGVWLVCSDDDFRGRCVTLDHSIARLSDIGLDDQVSSIRPVRRR